METVQNRKMDGRQSDFQQLHLQKMEEEL